VQAELPKNPAFSIFIESFEVSAFGAYLRNLLLFELTSQTRKGSITSKIIRK
jgi:hypothetical protein